MNPLDTVSNWERRLQAFLHDPPDKALRIEDHETRAVAYYNACGLGPIDRASLHAWTRGADSQAAAIERVPLPTAGPDGTRAVGPSSDGTLTVFHPLSGRSRTIQVHVQRVASGPDPWIVERIRALCAGLDAPKLKFLALWRNLPRDIDARFPTWNLLPADTRIPNHTIWNHLDIASAFAAADDGVGGAALLSFHLGPVQPFIEAARSLRDLWSGSFLLSWLTFEAMRPIIDQLGPQVMIYPTLRGNPLADRWLERQGVPVPNRDTLRERLRRPGLPNKFLALVPADAGEEMRAAAERSARQRWIALSEDVRAHLRPHWDPIAQGWDALWTSQIESCFELRATVVPLREASPELLERALPGILQKSAPVRALAELIPEQHRPAGYRQDQVGFWQARTELSARVMEANRAIRHYPPHTDAELVPAKCSLLGTYEQMGPGKLSESKEFWKNAALASPGGIRIRTGERLSAVALAKRYAPATETLRDLDVDDPRYPDTATVAAIQWLESAKIPWEQWRRDRNRGWSGQWLHWQTQNEEEDDPCADEIWKTLQAAKKAMREKPPIYYAILKMDGDEMGMWLKGDKSPTLSQTLHPRMREYFQNVAHGDALKTALQARMPVTPALHAALTEALGSFSVESAPAIVEAHKGVLIYAGGDDLLALLPTSTAIACAGALRDAYRGNLDGWHELEGRELLAMGSSATISAGIAVVHYKEDLRKSLRAARDAERQAKRAGRNALALTIARRREETAVTAWDHLKRIDWLVSHFLERHNSDRWTYHLRMELPTLLGLPADAVRVELRRLLKRTEGASEELIETVTAWFDEHNEWFNSGKREGVGLDDFVHLCQSASFLARGRESR